MLLFEHMLAASYLAQQAFLSEHRRTAYVQALVHQLKSSCVFELEWNVCMIVHRAVNQELQLANQAPFSPTDEASAVRTLQRLRQTQRGRDSFHSMANLVSSHSHISSAYTDSRLWADADKPFLPLSLAVLQPKLKVSLLAMFCKS